jgi:hypothetical protein
MPTEHAMGMKQAIPGCKRPEACLHLVAKEIDRWVETDVDVEAAVGKQKME